MKTIYPLITLLSFFFFEPTHAQEWFPIGAKWYYDGAGHGMGNPSAAYILNKCIKDTVVVNQPCRKIISTYSNQYTTDGFIESIYLFHTHDSVMFYNDWLQKFTLLYKFNVQASDTIVLNFTRDLHVEDSTFSLLVDSVNYLTVDGYDLKRVYTSPLHSYPQPYMQFLAPYVERIGCLDLPMPEGGAIIPEKDGPIRCYSDNLIQHNFKSYDCDYIFGKEVGVNEVPNSEANLSLYPNPASTEISLSLNNSITIGSRLTHLKIFNQLGQEVYSQALTALSTNPKIDIRQLPAGLYWTTVNLADGTIVSAKFIKE